MKLASPSSGSPGSKTSADVDVRGKNRMQSTQHKWNAEDYAKNSSAQLQWAQELIAKLALQGGESVLDIGCGDGKISAQLSLSVNKGSVLGIDLSEDMIGLAAEQFPAQSYPNLSFRQMDAADIRLDKKFDVAFSNAALHWVADQMAVLRGVRACLKSGGKILFQMGGYGNADEVFNAIEEVVKRSEWRGHFQDFTPPYHFYRPEEYKEWLLKSGFHIVRAELMPKDMQHQGKEGLKGWLRTTWFPYTDRLSSELSNAFLDEVLESYLIIHPLDAQGNTHVKMVRLEIEALKNP
jgi:trans-aconitate 2-methyltransferase